MIAERFPELEKLGADEQLELASELARRALNTETAQDLPDDSVRLLEERLDYFLQHPETGTTWEALRKAKNVE